VQLHIPLALGQVAPSVNDEVTSRAWSPSQKKHFSFHWWQISSEQCCENLWS